MRTQGVTNLAAGATNSNVLSGSVFEFVKRPTRVRFYVVGNAAGEARATIQSGTDVLMEESPVSRAARFPIDPDDRTAEDIAMPGDRLILKLRNVGAGAIDVFWAVDAHEIG